MSCLSLIDCVVIYKPLKWCSARYWREEKLHVWIDVFYVAGMNEGGNETLRVSMMGQEAEPIEFME
jgi:hypothetical protein